MRPLITCEHASGRTPPELSLGLSEALLASHLSCDRGTARIAERLAAALGAPLHRGEWSRLVVDLNRREENPDVIAEESWGVRVPGNVGLAAEARAARVARWHRPYREAARADALALADDGGCFHLSIHSFDPTLDPIARTFYAGVLFDTTREPEASLAAALAISLAEGGRDVRLNEPYAGVPEGLTSWLRDQTPPERYVGIEIEASQGWMDGDATLDEFACALERAVRCVLAP